MNLYGLSQVLLVQGALRAFKAKRVPRDPMVQWVLSVRLDLVALAAVRGPPALLVRQDLMARRANEDPLDPKERRDHPDLR